MTKTPATLTAFLDAQAIPYTLTGAGKTTADIEIPDVVFECPIASQFGNNIHRMTYTKAQIIELFAMHDRTVVADARLNAMGAAKCLGGRYGKVTRV